MIIYLAVPIPEDISNLPLVLKRNFVTLVIQIVGFKLSMPQPRGAVHGEMAAGSAPPWITVIGNNKCLCASGPTL